MWLPGSDSPAHLTGKLPGDFGFDPLGLGVEADRLTWCVAFDGRWRRFAILCLICA